MKRSSFIGTCQIPAYPMNLPLSVVVAAGVVDEVALEAVGGNTIAKAIFPFVCCETSLSSRMCEAKRDSWVLDLPGKDTFINMLIQCFLWGEYQYFITSLLL